MNWEPIRKRLSLILKTDVELVQITRTIWNTTSIVFEVDGKVYFVLDSTEQHITVFIVEEIFLTGSEKGLVELLIQQYKNLYLSDSSTEKPVWERIQTWILRQLDEGAISVSLPESIFPSERLNEKWVPFLLQCGQLVHIDNDYKELKNLLDSFFDVETILVPLRDKQWIILASAKLLFESNEIITDDKIDKLEQEEALESFGYGLYDMLSNEWMGDCWLSAGRIMDPRTEMIRTVHELQQAVQLGRKYRQEDHLYFPWRLRLERLLDQVNAETKSLFMEQTLNTALNPTNDVEMIQTLEQFFEENCNVSETAKKLYIHRNTLLYRLDKFKQETNMDVRNFHHAVLVRIAMLLYKVTKH